MRSSSPFLPRISAENRSFGAVWTRAILTLLLLLGLTALAPHHAAAQVVDSTETEEVDEIPDAAVRPDKPVKNRLANLKHRDLQFAKKRHFLEGETVLDFPNVNRIAYYQNKKEMRKIRAAEKRKNYPKAYRLLRAYVARFGIQNFPRDTRLLWRTAQLAERVGHDTSLAKAYYRLALKHRRTNLQKVQLYYDSLDASERDLYVPIKYYYELVEYRKNVATFPPPKGVNISMGDEINSKFPDYGPALNTEDQFIFSSKRIHRGITDRPDEDLYYSHKEGSYWEPAKAFPKPINTQYNEGSACLSRDGQTLIFARCECPDCHGNCDLFISTLKPDSVWSPPQNLGPNVNSSSWDSQPTLSPEGDTLYFASDRLGGFGLSDIWFTYKKKNGEWAKAENLGPTVNTRESEVSPFLHPFYQVLYFSSRGQLLNYGDFDIYKTYRVGNHWLEPRNIGPLVNGKGSEYYFTIDAESKNLYYSRSEEDDIKNLDLYSFPLPMEAQPLAITHIQGTLVDSVTHMPLKGVVSIVDLTNGIEVASKYLRPDGSFDFDLIDKSRYMMLIQSPDYFTVEKEFDLETDTIFQVMTTLVDYSVPLIFKNLEFAANKAEILPEMKPLLDRIVIFMVDHPNFHLEIEGHTDSQGDPQENIELSQFRALAIKNYIIEKGQIDGNLIKATGYGSTQPLRDESTEEDRRINRRVQFKLIKPEPGTNEADSGTLDGW